VGLRGGGKTDGVLGDFLEHADAYGEHAIGLMIRRQRTELIETIERSRAIYTALGWTYHEQEKMWRAPNGARLRFAYLERDADAESYQGHSYTRMYVEEIGNFPSPANPEDDGHAALWCWRAGRVSGQRAIPAGLATSG
jgi:hypothetical protein